MQVDWGAQKRKASKRTNAAAAKFDGIGAAVAHNGVRRASVGRAFPHYPHRLVFGGAGLCIVLTRSHRSSSNRDHCDSQHEGKNNSLGGEKKRSVVFHVRNCSIAPLAGLKSEDFGEFQMRTKEVNTERAMLNVSSSVSECKIGNTLRVELSAQVFASFLHYFAREYPESLGMQSTGCMLQILSPMLNWIRSFSSGENNSCCGGNHSMRIAVHRGQLCSLTCPDFVYNVAFSDFFAT